MLRGQIAIALPKGRLLPEAIKLFEATGIEGLEGLMESRRLLCEDVTGAYRFMVLRPADIPTYVEHGATDIGVVGKDILLEQERDVYEPLDLKFGACRLVVAQPKNLRQRWSPGGFSSVRRAAVAAEAEEVVRPILTEVREKGDAALLEYARRFDGASLTPGALRVTPDEVKQAIDHLQPEALEALRLAAARG